MNILIAGGTGFIGHSLTNRLLNSNHKVTILGRNRSKIIRLYGDTVSALTWEEITSSQVQNHDAVINLAGQTISEKRWIPSVKQAIKRSRVRATQKLVNLCGALGNKSPRLLNASAVGIYGLEENNPQQPKPLDESWPIPLGHPTDFLSEVGQAWEQAVQPAIDARVSVVKMRFGVVLGLEGGMLKKLIPSVRWGLGSILGTGKQGISWIHIEDLVTAIEFLLYDNHLNGIFNLTSPNPINQATFIRTFAKAYHRPCFLHMPAALINLLFGEMGQELLLKGQWVIPTRLNQAGFTFKYPKLTPNIFKP